MATVKPYPESAFPVNATLRLLRSLYTHVCSLESLLPSEACALREGDSDEMRRLVRETLVASTALTGPPDIDTVPQLSGTIDMAEVVDQVQQRIFSAHAKHYQRERQAGRTVFATPKNVLALGYRLQTSDPNRGLTRTRSGLGTSYSSVFPNTIVSSLITSLEWDILASRLGADILIELLSSPTVAIFVPLPNACFLQVSGVPIAELHPHDFCQAAAGHTGPSRTAHVRAKRKRRRTKQAPLEPEHEERRRSSRDDPVSDSLSPVCVAVVPPTPVSAARSASVLSAEPSRRPTKRSRPLGPALSAPQLSCTVPDLHPAATPTAETSDCVAVSASSTKRLRAAQSIGSLSAADSDLVRATKRKKLATLHPNNAIVFARHRMYHIRVASAKGGKPPYGLPPKHILTRLPTMFARSDALGFETFKATAEAAARHLAKYIFPRQFGLHNPFTSPKGRASFDVMPDYLDREAEIKKLGAVKTPSRLKPVLPLLGKLATLSSRCNYRKLLDRHCPSKMKRNRSNPAQASYSTGFVRVSSSTNDCGSAALCEVPAQQSGEQGTQISRGDVSIEVSHPTLVIPHGQTQAQDKARAKPRLYDFGCSFHEVERFVQSTVAEVIPRGFWGSPENERLIQTRTSAFVRMRRFETTSVHALLQGFSVMECGWLGPNMQKATAADFEKRKELLSEFLFWFVDGFIIDLIRTNFYVTDAATHQNRPLYFRQDDWNALSAPLLAQLGSSVFEQVPPDQLIPLQRSRELAFSYVRLLPKETGVRPIVNLARRPIKLGLNGQKEVGQPINKVLQSVFDALTFEKKRKPQLVGSLVADPHQIYAKLRTLKERLLAKHDGVMPKLYFVKVDVRSAYDTIQQDKLLEIVESVLNETLYWVQKYSQVSSLAGRPTKAFKRVACTDGDYGAFTDLARKLAEELHNVILTDQVVYQNIERERLVQLLREHITTNLVKVSGRLYRQKTGIPQGSVLSSLLCSLFYGDMERSKLAFTDNENSTLLRYVDDFLFISTEKARAGRFLRTMDDGIPEYGCNISAEKRLTNFDIALKDGEVVPPLKDGEDFPWCGLAINTQTLEVRFSTSLTMEKDIYDQLTIQRCRTPGQAFINAMLRCNSAVKVRSHVMYTDTSHNSLATAYSNVYRTMLVVALKFQAYVHEWGIAPRQKVTFLFKVIQQVVTFEWAACANQSRSRKARTLGVELSLKRPWVLWLGYHAFRRVLSRQPAVYSPLIKEVVTEMGRPAIRGARLHLYKVVSSEGNRFADRANGEKRARRS